MLNKCVRYSLKSKINKLQNLFSFILSKTKILRVAAPQPRKETNDQGSKMAQNTTSDENNYQDSVSVSGSTDEDADSKESADEMSGMDSANSGSSSGEDSPTDDDNTRGNAEISIHTFDDSSEKNEDRPAGKIYLVLKLDLIPSKYFRAVRWVHKHRPLNIISASVY